jgi:hypothetical protein
VDAAAAAAGGGGGRRRRRGDYLSMSCVELRGAGWGDQLLCSWREQSGYWRGHATQLPTTIVTRFCGHTEFLRA